MSAFVWLLNPETGAPWRCPVAAADVWRAKGWRDADTTAEPDSEDSPAPKPASRKRGGETNTAPEEG